MFIVKINMYPRIFFFYFFIVIFNETLCTMLHCIVLRKCIDMHSHQLTFSEYYLYNTMWTTIRLIFGFIDQQTWHLAQMHNLYFTDLLVPLFVFYQSLRRFNQTLHFFYIKNIEQCQLFCTSTHIKDQDLN